MIPHFATLPLLLALLLSTAPVRAGSAFKLAHEIPIGGEGGWDYVSVDPAARRLYLAQSTRVVAVDLDQGQVIGQIDDTPGVHGFAIAHDLGRGFASAGKANLVSIVELSTLKTVGKVPTGENPDAILYFARGQEVYAFNGHGKSVTVFEARTGKVISTIPLDGKPEFAVADTGSHRIYVPLEDRNEVAAIDVTKHQVVSRWRVSCDEPNSTAIDPARHRLFVGCGGKRLLSIDTGTGKELSSIEIGGGVDATAFDPSSGLVYASCGEGSVTIARADAHGKLSLVERLRTQAGARTMALDPTTHTIYLPVGRYDESAPPEGHHRKIVPGSVKLLVYAPTP
jgi:DNA-binding beta-propeller fold protein YncE